MQRMFLAMVLTAAVAAPALAQPMGPPTPEERERIERKVRMHMTLELADRLGLDERGALRISQTLDKFTERRRALHEQMRKQRELIDRAAAGDAEAQKGLVGAVTQLRDAEKQLTDLRFEEFKALSDGLSPTQQAKLAQALVEMPRHLRKMAHGGPGRMHRPGGRRGWDMPDD